MTPSAAPQPHALPQPRARQAPAGTSRSRWPWVAAAILVAVVAAIGLLRGGGLGLPAPPRGVTAAQAGLADLDRLRAQAEALAAAVTAGTAGQALPALDPEIAPVAEGLLLLRGGDPEQGVARLRDAYVQAPRSLVAGNAFRMAVLDLKRAWMADPSRGPTQTERVPAWLASEPRATTERVHRETGHREAALQHALAWADEILIFHALEIRAPANVESVKLLTELLRREPAYVPALFGRGLGYLHRPAHLVWPGARDAPADAASRDFGMAVAIGTRVGGASARLRAELALTLGDAYGKEGRAERARSWWQIAENAGGDPAVRDAVRRRFAWNDAELGDRLEAELERRMLDLGTPLTDLAVMWR